MNFLKVNYKIFQQFVVHLREAVDALKNDMSFLTKGDVFTEDQIEAYIDLKMEEVIEFEHAPHPVEFKMYYSS